MKKTHLKKEISTKFYQVNLITDEPDLTIFSSRFFTLAELFRSSH